MAFLGIKIEPSVARLFRSIEIPGEKVAESDFHITVLCFDDNWPIKTIGKAMEAAYEVISECKPFHIKTKTVTCFPKREDNPVPIIAKVESKELQTIWKDLKKSFDEHKVDYLKTFKEFKPHVTMAWAEEEIKNRKIDPIDFVVTEMVLWGGDNGDDRIFITIPLKGSERKKNSYLIQKADLFSKLALKDPDSVFTKSEERRKEPR